MLAGGRGERFWPLSRASRPKQLLPLFGRSSLLEQTVSRVLPLVPPERILVMTSERLEADVRKKLRRFGRIRVIGEPASRNTAPALGVASFLISLENRDAVTLVLPSDHIVQGRREFQANVRLAVAAAEQRRLVVFGIKPTRPETGYGYIQAGPRIGSSEKDVFAVRRFVEKPDIRKAKRFLRSGSYFWNSGMFAWRVDDLLAEMKQHMPSLAAGLDRLSGRVSGRTLAARLKGFYSRASAASIDYGLLERSENIAMIKADFSWDDLGSWVSLERTMKKDANGNVSEGQVVSVDTTNCVLFSGDGLVATIGVEDLVVVRTEGVTLVCSKEHAQGIRKISRILSSSGKLRRLL